MAIIDDFKVRFPEFDEAVVDQYLPQLIEAYPAYYNMPYGPQSKEAILNLLAHMLYTDYVNPPAGGVGSGSGNVSSKSIKGVSVSYENYTDDYYRSFFSSSAYGRRYLFIIRRPRPWVAFV